MANSYTESSSLLSIPKEKHSKAQEIIDRVKAELENGEEGYCGCHAIMQDSGVWFSGVESINPEHVELIARDLIEELEIDEPFFCSWAYHSDRPIVDEFGGGAFLIKRGYETYWCDARNHVEQQLEKGGLIPLELWSAND